MKNYEYLYYKYTNSIYYKYWEPRSWIIQNFQNMLVGIKNNCYQDKLKVHNKWKEKIFTIFCH